MSNDYKQGGTGILLKIAFRNIWRNKRRTAFCFSAVGIAVFFIIIYSSMIDGMTKSINDIVQIFELGHVRVVSSDYEAEQEYMPVMYPVSEGKNWQELAAKIGEVPGVRAVFPRIAAFATLHDSSLKHAILWGLDIEGEMAANSFNLTNRDNGLVAGHYPRPGSNEAAIGHIFAEKTGLGMGDRIMLRTTSAEFSDRFWNPLITGIYNYDYYRYDEQFIIVDFERLNRLLLLNEGTQQLVIFASDERQSSSIAARVQHILGEDDLVREWTDNYWVAVMRMVMPVYTIVFLIFLIVASFLIVNTVVMIIHERIKEIGMMGSLGMTRLQIVQVFFFESLFLASFGAFIGVFAGGTFTAIMAAYPIRMGDLYGSTFSDMPLSNAIFFQFSHERLIMAWIMGVLIASIFTLFPSLKSAFVKPVEALRR